jgi:hypothetical protein
LLEPKIEREKFENNKNKDIINIPIAIFEW